MEKEMYARIREHTKKRLFWKQVRRVLRAILFVSGLLFLIGSVGYVSEEMVNYEAYMRQTKYGVGFVLAAMFIGWKWD